MARGATGSALEGVRRAHLAEHLGRVENPADRDYGSWRCAEETLVGKVRTLVCHLTPEAGRSDDFGLDLHLDPDVFASITAPK